MSSAVFESSESAGVLGLVAFEWSFFAGGALAGAAVSGGGFAAVFALEGAGVVAAEAAG